MNLEEAPRLASAIENKLTSHVDIDAGTSVKKRPRQKKSARYFDLFKDCDFSKCVLPDSSSIQYVDFFAGCGGMSYGFHRAQMSPIG